MEDGSAAVEADGNEKSEEPMDVNCEKDVREDVAEKENEVDSSNDRKEESGECKKEGEGEQEEKGEAEVEGPPDYSLQKEEIQPLLSQKLRKGDEWYLVDQKWLKQWKKYVGFDAWEQFSVGKDTANPGPVDNSNLFKSVSGDVLKEHLMEELDYALLPKPAWDKLSKWYGLSDGSRPIIRRVVEYGTYVKHLKVEVYLVELKLCIHPHVNESKVRFFSRADLTKDLQEEMLKLFELPEDLECRLWQRYMTNSYELLNKPEQTLSDASVYGGQLIMLEKKSPDGKWPRDQSSVSSTYSGGSSVGGSTGYGGYSSGYSSYYEKREPTTPGLCGLTNLGNTCFMNSALQCLSNTQPLTEYFIGGEKGGEKPYKKHINRDNPLGMGGALADTYGHLLEEMWSGGASYLAPRQFKTMIGRHAPQFSGYQQQDSQELVAFLLDGLHEDLNLVRKKPYVDMDIRTQGREDKDIAEETWYKYQLRNQSAIVRLFQGLQKSTLVCPECKKTSVIFEPFMYLPLPLPTKSRDITLFVVRADPSVPVTKVRVSVPKTGSVLMLKEALQRLVDIDSNKLVAIDVYHSRFHRVYYDKDPVSHILDRDDIYLYELKYPLGDPDWTPVPVYHRELKEAQAYGYSSRSTYGSVFGLPLVVSVPRKGCSYQTLRCCILNHCTRYVKITQGHPWNKELQNHLLKERLSLNKNKSGLNNESMTKMACEDDDGNVITENKDHSDCNESQPSEHKKQDGSCPREQHSSSVKEGGVDDDDEETKKMDTDQDGEEECEDLFSLIAVNSYGSQEVKQFVDDGSLLHLNSQTYVSCDWKKEMAKAHYDTEAAEEVVIHESCEDHGEGKKPVTVYNCIDLYCEKEVLGERDAWFCPHCKQLVKASKKFDLWKMPEILVVFFKRFSYTQYFRNKLEMHIEFPIDGLDLSNYIINQDEPQPLYDLFAISNHFGSLGGGHYTAYAKNREMGKWYGFDDSHVQEVKNLEHMVSASAYVLFYRRRTEGTRASPQLNRSLSVSYAEEMRERGKKFRGAPSASSDSMEVDSNKIEEADEEKGEAVDAEGNEDNEDSAFKE